MNPERRLLLHLAEKLANSGAGGLPDDPKLVELIKETHKAFKLPPPRPFVARAVTPKPVAEAPIVTEATKVE